MAFSRQMTVLLLGMFCGMAWGLGGQVRAVAAGTSSGAKAMVCYGTLTVRPAQAELPRDTRSGEAAESSRKVEALRQATFLLVVLVLVFAVSLLAFRRWSKHYRARLLREPHEATPADDVWAMHRLDDSEGDSEDHGIDAPDDEDARPDDDIADGDDESR